MDRWISPSGFMILLGGIIWGIQLNVAVITNGKDIASIRDQHIAIVERLDEISRLNLEQAFILEGVSDEMQRTAAIVDEHEKSSDLWKERIIKLEARKE